MNLVRGSRVAALVEWAVVLVLTLHLGTRIMPRAWGALISDFPSYYLTARLAHEGYDTSRVYEWVWLQREKDHRAVDVRTAAMIPSTPFSALVFWPLTSLDPLAAKRVWLTLNLALLAPLGWLLHEMTGLRYRHIALIIGLSTPLESNLVNGQYYLLLLFLIVAACRALLGDRQVIAGVLLAIAAAAKIFPVLLFALPLERRAWRALVAGLLAGAAALALSVGVFGWNLNRTYLGQVLPRTMHGEGYAPGSESIAEVLHRLFLREPQWNPHPWHSSPLAYSLLAAALPMLILAPALLLTDREDRSRERILLEWSALLAASLAISTSPASYNFVLLVLPVCVLAARLLERREYGWLAMLGAIYLGVGRPLPSPPPGLTGLPILLSAPRLVLMLMLLAWLYALLTRGRPGWDRAKGAWAAGMTAMALFSAVTTLRVERAVRTDYDYRLPQGPGTFLWGNPREEAGRIFGVAAWFCVSAIDAAPGCDVDHLSFAGDGEHQWVERGLSPRSVIVDARGEQSAIEDARDPVLSADGESLAYIRDDRGRGRLMLHRPGEDQALTPGSLNVYEATIRSASEYAFSATREGRPPEIFLTDRAGHLNLPLALGESRYPALSPDGRWMAYSRLEHGAWNLWIRDQQSGTTRRVADVPCNQIQLSWEHDSKTLLYATDCGRSVWQTALARRRMID